MLKQFVGIASLLVGFVAMPACADEIQSYNFSAQLIGAINGSNSVEGQYSIDFTTLTISDYSLITPVSTIDPASGFTAVINETGFGTFLDVSIRFVDAGYVLYLDYSAPENASLFDATVFNQAMFGQGYLLAPVAQVGSELDEIVSANTAPAANATPEPRTVGLLVGGLLLMLSPKAIQRQFVPSVAIPSRKAALDQR